MLLSRIFSAATPLVRADRNLLVNVSHYRGEISQNFNPNDDSLPSRLAAGAAAGWASSVGDKKSKGMARLDEKRFKVPGHSFPSLYSRREVQQRMGGTLQGNASG